LLQIASAPPVSPHLLGSSTSFLSSAYPGTIFETSCRTFLRSNKAAFATSDFCLLTPV
jgi:hypothetical protein